MHERVQVKKRYIDQYGIDSLPHLKAASDARVEIFVTSNKSVLEDREELEQYFDMKIRSPEEMWDEKKKS
jgi:hypothetical protein